MSNRGVLRFPSAACWVLMLAAAGPLQVQAAPAEAGPYVDASAYVQGEAQIEAWYAMLQALRRDFSQICGDTFCEGEYSNIEPLRFRCSVHSESGRIGACLWVFAASEEEIDPATGEIQVRPKFWRCRAPLAPHTTIEELLSAVAGQSPLYAPLPGSGRSVYDGLADCL